MKLLIELDEECVKVIDKIKFLVGGRADRKLQLEIIKAIKNGVPLEQESRWIPCRERLPEEDTDVLVTLKCGLIGIMQKKLADDDNGEPCYIWQDFEGEEHEVIAWMPLPKPYGVESEDKE